MMIKIIPPSSKRIHFKKNSIHYTLKFFFIILLCAGFLPVEGIFSSSEDLRFTWFSCLVIYSLYVFTLASAMCIFQLYHYFASSSDDVTLRKSVKKWLVHVCVIHILGEIIFICTAIQASIFFIQLASKWPKLIQKWCKLDEKFNTVYGYPKLLKLKLILVTAIYIILVLGELNRHLDEKMWLMRLIFRRILLLRYCQIYWQLHWQECYFPKRRWANIFLYIYPRTLSHTPGFNISGKI